MGCIPESCTLLPQGGWNPAALWACAAGLAPSLPGFLHEVGLAPSVGQPWRSLFSLSWFVGTGLAMLVYCWLMRAQPAAGLEV